MKGIKPKFRVISIVVAAGVISAIVWQRGSNARLRQELNEVRAESRDIIRVREENERLAAENWRLAKRKVDYDALERLRAEQGELLRLRGQVEALRNQLAEAQQQAATNMARRARASDPKTVENSQARVQAFARRAYLGDWATAFRDFALENNGQFPTDFTQAQAQYEKARTQARPGQVGVSPRTGAYFKSLRPEEFEIVYQGSLSKLTNPASAIVLRERQPRRLPDGRWARCYGFADGSAVEHLESDGNFEEWERAPTRPGKAAPAARRYSFYGQR